MSAVDLATATAGGPAAFEPILIGEVELGGPLLPLAVTEYAPGQRYRRARLLVRVHGCPLGLVDLALDDAELAPAALAALLWHELRDAIVAHQAADGLPVPTELTSAGLPPAVTPACLQARAAALVGAPLVSVVVCTRDRPAALAVALRSLLAQDGPPYELVVVDNAPRTDATTDLLAGEFAGLPNLRYVREERPGLSWARNRGLLEARGEIIAFTDDDVVVDRHWLAGLLVGFAAAPHVACVSGLTLPAELETPAQLWFEQYGGFGKGLARRIYDLGQHRPDGLLFPYTSGQFGSGVNMAIRSAVLRELGGFTPLLGAGSPSMGGEDLMVFFTIVSRGYTLVYEPSALLYHYHRRDDAGLRRQMLGYGVGLTAYLAHCVWDDPRRLLDMARRAPQGLRFAVSPHSPKNRKKQTDYPAELTRIELRGMLYGPLAYLRSHRQAHATRRRFGALGPARAVQPHQETHLRRLPHGGAAQYTEPAMPTKTTAAPVEPAAPNFQPIRVLEVEISQPLPDVPASDPRNGRSYQLGRSLVRLYGEPLGIVELALDGAGLGAEEYAAVIWRALGPALNERLRAENMPQVDGLTAAGLPPSGTPRSAVEAREALADAPFMSVVVPTRNRPGQMDTCLQQLLALNYPHYEIIVVDNRPSDSATADMVRTKYGHLPNVRYVREDHPGVDWARNRGLLESKGEIIACTDDDVVVDRDWLVGLARAFRAAPNVGCVTGLTLPAELETSAQLWFEQYGGFSRGFARMLYDMAKHRPKARLYPYVAGAFGSSANMAIRAAVLREINGFDPALGSGSLALGGGDIAAYFQVITKGYTLVYEPSALVYHVHRRDYAGLRKQIYSYGVGFTSYLIKCLLDDPKLILDLATKLPYGLFVLLSPKSTKHAPKPTDYPKDLTEIELRGMLYGPIAYLRSRLHIRSVEKQLGPILLKPRGSR